MQTRLLDVSSATSFNSVGDFSSCFDSCWGSFLSLLLMIRMLMKGNVPKLTDRVSGRNEIQNHTFVVSHSFLLSTTLYQIVSIVLIPSGKLRM